MKTKAHTLNLGVMRRFIYGILITLFVTVLSAQAYADGIKLGVGTSEVPLGGIGCATVAIHGDDSVAADAPVVQYTTDADDYPVICVHPGGHGNSVIRFDSYFDPTPPPEETGQRSSYGGDACLLVKYENTFTIERGVPESAEANQELTRTPCIKVDLDDGEIRMPEVYSAAASARALYITPGGKLGTLSSSIRFKENVKDIGAQDRDWLLKLRPRIFDYKDRSLGTNQFGLIAEEVEEVCPKLVTYEPADLDTPAETEEDESIDSSTSKSIPYGVRYEQLVVPLLAEVQELQKTVADLKAQVAELKAEK